MSRSVVFGSSGMLTKCHPEHVEGSHIPARQCSFVGFFDFPSDSRLWLVSLRSAQNDTCEEEQYAYGLYTPLSLPRWTYQQVQGRKREG